MKRGYTIKKQVCEWGKGYLTYTMQIDGSYALATNTPLVNDSLSSAKSALNQLWHKSHNKASDYIYIQGPKGGSHRVSGFTRH